MKNLKGILLFGVATALVAVAQQPQAAQRGQFAGRAGGAGFMGGGFDQTRALLRVIEDPETAAALKLTAEQKTALKEKSAQFDQRQEEVAQRLQTAALEQVALADKVMADKKSPTDELMALVEKIGAITTEQAKLQTERLLAIRDVLTAEQISQAGEVAKQRMEQMRERMRQRFDQRGGAQGQGGPGQRGGQGMRGQRGQGGGAPQNAPLPQRPAGWEE